MPTTKSTSAAISANDELLRALSAMEHQNVRLQRTLSKIFAKAAEPLLKVHRSAAQEVLSPNRGGTMALHSPAQRSLLRIRPIPGTPQHLRVW